MEQLKAILQAAQAVKEEFCAQVLAEGRGHTVYDPVHQRVILFANEYDGEGGPDWFSRN